MRSWKTAKNGTKFASEAIKAFKPTRCAWVAQANRLRILPTTKSNKKRPSRMSWKSWRKWSLRTTAKAIKSDSESQTIAKSSSCKLSRAFNHQSSHHSRKWGHWINITLWMQSKTLNRRALARAIRAFIRILWSNWKGISKLLSRIISIRRRCRGRLRAFRRVTTLLIFHSLIIRGFWRLWTGSEGTICTRIRHSSQISCKIRQISDIMTAWQRMNIQLSCGRIRTSFYKIGRLRICIRSRK